MRSILSLQRSSPSLPPSTSQISHHSLLAHRLRLVGKHLLHALPSRQTTDPLRIVRIVLLQVELLLLVQEWNHGVPRHEGEIGEGELATDEVGRGLKDVVEDHGDAVDLLDVAGLGRGDLFRVEVGEPGCRSD